MVSRFTAATLALLALAGCHRRAVERHERCAPGAADTTTTTRAAEPTSTTTLTQAELNPPEVKLEPQPAPAVPVQPAEPIGKVPPPPPPADTSAGSLTIIDGSSYEKNMGIADGGPNAAPQSASQQAPSQSTLIYESVTPYPPSPERDPGPPSAADRIPWTGAER